MFLPTLPFFRLPLKCLDQINQTIFYFKNGAGRVLHIVHSLLVQLVGNSHNMREIARRLDKEWMGGIVVYQGDTLKKVAQPNI